MQFYIIILWANSVRWCSDIYYTFVHNLTILNRLKFIKPVVRYNVEHQRQKKKNDDDEQSEHSQNAKIVIRQESDVTFKKTTQLETRNDNEKIFSHEFSENDAVDYTALVEKKRTRNKNLKLKRKYQILLKKNKRLQTSFRNDEVSVSIRRRRNAVRASNNFFDETSQFKRQRSVAELKSANLNLYYDKSYKEFKDWTRSAFNAFEINSFYFFNEWEKIRWAQ